MKIHLTKRQRIIIGIAVALLLLLVLILLLLLRKEDAPASPREEASVAPSPQARKLGTGKFPPRARAQSLANVDVGIKTVSLPGGASPSPKANAATRIAVENPILPLAGSPDPGASPTPGTDPAAPPILAPLAPPAVTPPPLPPPVLPPPAFAPLAPPPVPQGKELVVAYAKGESGKRQIYLRSVERDKDDQLVSSVYDDFGVSFSGAAQKVAYYSNEEGPSDSTKSRTKLKVADLASGKVQLITGSLPGNWPASWSPDGRKIAIPTVNSIFISDTTTGTSLQVPTGKNPGGIVWVPSGLKFYFQAEVSDNNHDLFEADALTAQARPVTKTGKNEYQVSPSDDGTKVSFLRDQADDRKGAALVVRTLASGDERTFSETQGAESYLLNLTMTEVVFVRADTKNKLSHLKAKDLTEVTALDNQTLLSFDRDFDHVFVLADDDDGRSLFSVEIATGSAEKIKSGVAETVFSQR